MITFKKLEMEDVEGFWNLLNALDIETNLDEWAKENGIVRLELTVECHNKAARHLYEKSGFEIEGIRTKSMFVEGTFVDEYYMAKITGGFR